jgi:hypothetical protein
LEYIFYNLLLFQACEQLNSWLGGFDSILKRMTQGNFNWFLHTMLFYHTRYVIRKQELNKDSTEEEEEEGGTVDDSL